MTIDLDTAKSVVRAKYPLAGCDVLEAEDVRRYCITSPIGGLPTKFLADFHATAEAAWFAAAEQVEREEKGK